MNKKQKRYFKLIAKAIQEYGEENHVVAVPGFMSKQFSTYCSIREDLRLMLEYIKILKTNPANHYIKSSLTYALIALYGKCFTDSTKTKRPKLEPNQVFSKKKKNRKIHEYLISLRHDFIAHRGNTLGEIGIAFLAIPKGDNGQSQIRYRQSKIISFNDKKLEKTESLVKFLIKEVESKIQKCGQRAYNGFFNTFSEKEMAVMIMNNLKIPGAESNK
ncbi:hypothetical protein NYZ99_09225 [Maribacter litopenaei]|uniref:RiboL-PSP-HEPN domain-containing protein n=1 Tax=Maribacter litopenaei TaxID=2976127 RepID=A0ABY5YBR2_9FLAO|nr:hypothetical protein [Maribacter litopenaei]UWX56359.1 hypothetical protein NYZ99_09225 [Maribacter litopenaei]